MATPKKALLKELAKRKQFQAKAQQAQEQFLSDLFDQQRALIFDPAKRKAALCSRRAGKTHTCLVYLAKTCLEKPNATCFYFARSRYSAKLVLWHAFKAFNSKYGLGFDFHEGDFTATAPNGSRVILSGAKDKETVERLRGNKVDLCILDEAASYPPHLLRYLVNEIMEPALMDHDGTLVMVSNPGSLCSGPFYEATTKPDDVGYSLHRWNLLDNPHLSNPQAFLDSTLKRNNWTVNDPEYVREYRGEWVNDADQFVYKFYEDRNTATALPEAGEWSYVIGADLGYRDETAFCVLGWREHDPTLYVVESFGEAELIPSVVAEKLLILRDTYAPVAIAMDCGALGLPIAEEFRQKYGLRIEPAKKAQKPGAISSLNGDMRQGKIKILASLAPLIEQLKSLQWKPEKTGIQEQPGEANDLCDSFLYAYRHARHYAESFQPEAPKPGTHEYYRLEEERLRQQHTRKPDPDETHVYGWEKDNEWI